MNNNTFYYDGMLFLDVPKPEETDSFVFEGITFVNIPKPKEPIVSNNNAFVFEGMTFIDITKPEKVESSANVNESLYDLLPEPTNASGNENFDFEDVLFFDEPKPTIVSDNKNVDYEDMLFFDEPTPVKLEKSTNKIIASFDFEGITFVDEPKSETSLTIEKLMEINNNSTRENKLRFMHEDFKILNVPGDGNCFYHSIILALKNKSNSLISGFDDEVVLRRYIVEEIKKTDYIYGEYKDDIIPDIERAIPIINELFRVNLVVVSKTHNRLFSYKYDDNYYNTIFLLLDNLHFQVIEFDI